MIKDCIEVYVRRVSRGTRYLEYEREKPKFNTNTCIAYIRATTGEQFEVHVKLHQAFRYYTSTGIQVRLCIDANEAPDVYFWNKVQVGVDGHDYTISDFQVKVAGEWQSGKLAFGEIGGGKAETTVQFKGLFENTPTNPVPLNNFAEDTTTAEFRAYRRHRLGTIRISVQRGHIDCANVDHPERPSPFNLTASDADKKKGITHEITTVHSQRIETPESDTTTNFRPILGVHGERYNFEFRYRSLPELARLGLCDESGRILEPELEPEPIVPEDDDDGEEDGLPIPPHRRLSRSRPPPPPSSGQRTSSRLRAIAEAGYPALPPVKEQTPKSANKRDQSIAIKQEKQRVGSKTYISSADRPVRSIEIPDPGTETHNTRLNALKRLPEPTPGPGANSLRPTKRRYDLTTQPPEPSKKPRLGDAEKPGAGCTQALGPPSVSAARTAPPYPISVGADTKLVRCGENIGTFSAKAAKLKQEPCLSAPQQATPAAGPSISTTRSVPGGPSVSTKQGVSGPKGARTPTNAPAAPRATPAKPGVQSGPPTTTEYLDLEFKAIDIRGQLNVVDKKMKLLENEKQDLLLSLDRIHAQKEMLRIKGLDHLPAAGPARQQQQQQQQQRKPAHK